MTATDLLHNRDPRAEAVALAGPAARVLEPSPPTVSEEPFADDPLGAEGSTAIATWTEWLTDNPDHADWVSERWLAGARFLGTPPATLSTTRLALHRLATYVIAPVRHAANGKFGLRWTLGGFGTPFFGENRQVRVVGTQLVDQTGDTARTATITSLAAAAEFLGTDIDAETAAEHDSPSVGDVDETLAIDADAAEFLGRWYGMAFAALEAVRHDPASVDASRPQLWPGHFDPAIEVGDEDHRGSYGASPGDHAIDEPYLYVSIWWPDRIGIDTDDPFWNAPSFTGAIKRLSDFGDGDPVTEATAFWNAARDHMTNR